MRWKQGADLKVKMRRSSHVLEVNEGRVSKCQIDVGGICVRWRSWEHSIIKVDRRTVLDSKELIEEALVRQLCKKRGYHINIAVNDYQTINHGGCLRE